MTPEERRASFLLASVFALRMLGLFLVLPVFTLSAGHYEGGHNAALVGLAMGIYGLTQAALQWPLGWCSDRFGRKLVIIGGLLVFALGAVVAARADSVWGLVLGRAIQGAGAISAAASALLADQTRSEVRTKAMALVGISIGASFSIALVLGPWLGGLLGLSGLFWLIAVLALLCTAVVGLFVPTRSAQACAGASGAAASSRADEALQPPPEDEPDARARQLALRRLQISVFVLHALQMAMWSALPLLLVRAGIAEQAHWHVYLPAVFASVVCFGAVFALERRGRIRLAFLISIGLIVLAQAALAWLSLIPGTGAGGAVAVWYWWALVASLFVFFCGFNSLEALQPSEVSRQAGSAARGSAMGLYSTMQSLGLFTGGTLGGVLVGAWGISGLFISTLLLAVAWLVLTVAADQPGRIRVMRLGRNEAG